MTEAPHKVSIRPEQAADGVTWHRAVCTCGQPIRHIHDTRAGAERSGRGHIAVNTPPPPGRYQIELEGREISLCCLDCDQYLLAVHSDDEETRAIVLATAVEAHEGRRHADDTPTPTPLPTLPLLPPVQLAPDDDSVRWTALSPESNA